MSGSLSDIDNDIEINIAHEYNNDKKGILPSSVI